MTISAQTVTCKKMDKLLNASENFEQANFDEKTFLEFMKEVTVWEYFGLSKDTYLALPESEKRIKISKYYIEMKNKATGDGESVCLIF